MSDIIEQLKASTSHAVQEYEKVKFERNSMRDQASKAEPLATELAALQCQAKLGQWALEADHAEWQLERAAMTHELAMLQARVEASKHGHKDIGDRRRVTEEESERLRRGIAATRDLITIREADRERGKDTERRIKEKEKEHGRERDKQRAAEVRAVNDKVRLTEGLLKQDESVEKELNRQMADIEEAERKLRDDTDTLKAQREREDEEWRKARAALLADQQADLDSLARDHKQRLDGLKKECRDTIKEKDDEIERLRQLLNTESEQSEAAKKALDDLKALRLQEQKERKMEIQKSLAGAFERSSTTKLMRFYYEKILSFSAYRVRERRMRKLQKELENLAEAAGD